MSNRAAFRCHIRSRCSIANPQQVLPLAKVAFEPHALGDIQLSLANGNLACYIIQVVAPMETVPQFLAVVAFLGVFVVSVWVFAAGIASGSGKSKFEDQAQYEHFNPPVKPVGEVHRKEPTPPPTTDSAVTVDKKPEKVAVSDDLDKPKSVIAVMVKKVFYCFENQSVDEARRIMREHDLPYLLVLDRNMRIVGMVRMRDLGDEDRPQSEG